MYVILWFSPLGLDKLIEASEQVTELSKELAIKEKDLAIASAKAEEVLKEVTKSAAAAEKVKNQVQKVKDKAQSIVDVIDAEKKVYIIIIIPRAQMFTSYVNLMHSTFTTIALTFQLGQFFLWLWLCLLPRSFNL
mgnify:CR=1 FL=1